MSLGSDSVFSAVCDRTRPSHSSPLVDLWAPGADICSAVPVGLDRDGTADGVDCSHDGWARH